MVLGAIVCHFMFKLLIKIPYLKNMAPPYSAHGQMFWTVAASIKVCLSRYGHIPIGDMLY